MAGKENFYTLLMNPSGKIWLDKFGAWLLKENEYLFLRFPTITLIDGRLAIFPDKFATKEEISQVTELAEFYKKEHPIPKE